MKIYDISIPLCDQTPVWEGDKEVKLGRTSSISGEEEYNVSMLEMGAHAGTHVDAPFHVFADGLTVDRIPLEKLIGEAQVIRIPETVTCITQAIIMAFPLQTGIRSVLFRTKYSRYWVDQPQIFHEDFVGLDTGAANGLVEAGIQLVGIDGFSIAMEKEMLQTHRILLEAGVVIVENLDLHEVPAGIYHFCCLPLKLIGTDGAPARAILSEIDPQRGTGSV